MSALDIQPSPQAKADRYARWSMYLGAASLLLTCLSGIPALLLGALALGRTSPASKKEAVAGICLGALTLLGTIAFLAVAALMPAPPKAAASTPSAGAAAVPTSAVATWKPGETVTVGKCSYRLVKAYKRIAPEADQERSHRLWEAVVAIEATQTDELDAFCAFNLQMRTAGSARVLGEDSKTKQVPPGTKECMSEGVSESVPKAIADVGVVLQLSPDSPKDEGFLKGVARYSTKRKEVKVEAKLLSWDEYSEKVPSFASTIKPGTPPASSCSAASTTCWLTRRSASYATSPTKPGPHTETPELVDRRAKTDTP